MSFDMYQENILDHYEHPYHRGALETPTLDYRDLNPLCGDEVRVQARVDESGCLVEAYFDGAGCVISLASASMLMEAVEGKTLAGIKVMERQDMLDLLGIPLTTMRVKCALLALRTLAKSIHLYESAATAPPPFSVSDWCCFELVRASERNTAHEYKISSQLSSSVGILNIIFRDGMISNRYVSLLSKASPRSRWGLPQMTKDDSWDVQVMQEPA